MFGMEAPTTLMSWPELEQSYSYQKCKLPWSQSPVVFYFSSWTPLEQPCMNIETNMFLELQKTAYFTFCLQPAAKTDFQHTLPEKQGERNSNGGSSLAAERKVICNA